jgi:predicted XRE-type DNA-binding protein
MSKGTFDHSGSSFDSFLDEEGIREEIEAVAIKRVLAWQLENAMRKLRKTKQAMARELHTSRSQLDRLLDPRNVAISLDTITRAAKVLGKRLTVRITDAKPQRTRHATLVKTRSRTASRSPVTRATHRGGF